MPSTLIVTVAAVILCCTVWTGPVASGIAPDTRDDLAAHHLLHSDNSSSSVYNVIGNELDYGSNSLPSRRPTTIFQNEFAVYIPNGEDIADGLAAKYGFTNLGQVSPIVFDFFFISFKVPLRNVF